MESKQKGKLYICGTPIGNLEDITLRSLNILKTVDLIAAEDTRHTRKLLNFYHIKKPLTSYYEFNKDKKSSLILQHLEKGQNVALVSDAGMPGICDPGFEIVNLAIKNGFPVAPIPGVSALTTALVVSGFDMSRFIFDGFVPRKKSDKLKYFTSLKDEKRTMIFYESPHRLKDTLGMMLKIMGDRQIVINRELTKLFEEIKRGSLSEMINWAGEKELRGEFTLVLEGVRDKKDEKIPPIENKNIQDEIKKKMNNYLKKGYYNEDIILLVMKEYGVPKNWVYQKIVDLRKDRKQSS
ncbi:MAG: 16S rRNA (cytidine(1402)-2'-O)-methyltransferase [Candidatus Atribacteria bacterium]|nr:16S rRNA (cytidine(1402)-2'-O)-methyltransferase [Candidatus Atribacteria bacterium]